MCVVCAHWSRGARDGRGGRKRAERRGEITTLGYSVEPVPVAVPVPVVSDIMSRLLKRRPVQQRAHLAGGAGGA